MSIITEVAGALQHVLATVANDTARTTHFTRRQSKCSGAVFVQSLVFGWLANPAASLHELSQTAAAVGVRLSPQALDQRFTSQAAAYLQAVLQQAVQQAVQQSLSAAAVPLPLLQRFGAVWVEDSSVVSLPEALRGLWPGCGERVAGVKLHVRWDLKHGPLQGPALRPARLHDRSGPLPQDLQPGSLWIADLGYFCLRHLQEMERNQVYYLSRVQAGTQVWAADQRGQLRRWTMLELLRWRQRRSGEKVSQWDVAVRLGAKAGVPCRLLVVRVPPAIAAQRRVRLQSQAQRKQQAVSAERLALAEWTILVTNVPAAQLSVAEALVLYGARWQIERLFRLWKEVGQIDTWRSAQPWRILCEVYAKLIGQVVQHWLLVSAGWAYADRSLTKAAITLRHHAWQVLRALAHPRRLRGVLRQFAFCVSCGCRINKRRRAPAAYQRLGAVCPADFP
jgi:hypothetical protein